jgi:uncharacterized protein YciI
VGGPFAGPDLEGMGIYSPADSKEVEAIVKQDPFVANEVLSITRIASWYHCTAAKE